MTRGSLNGIAPLQSIDIANSPHGLKTLGCAKLLSEQAGSPLPYYLPENVFAIQPRSAGRVSENDLRAQFYQMVSLSKTPIPWFARSDALDESPGKYDSPPVLIDPNDKDSSWQRFYRTVSQMLGSNENLGVLLMPMLGGWKTFADGTRGYGYDLVSFVADTVNPAKTDEMHIAIVQGLGHGAVGSDNAVLITADRETGEITFFGHRDENLLKQRHGSMKVVNSRERYRQKEVHYFEPTSGKVKQRLLETDFFDRLASPYILSRGRLELLELYVPCGDFHVLGLTPFDNLAMFGNLISILQYVHTEHGPSQIEGAFLDRSAPYPYFLQHIHAPPSVVENRELTIADPHFVSDRVIGRGQFEVPFIEAFCLPESKELDNISWLRSIDRRYAETGYILYAEAFHPMRTVEATPHCRFRLSWAIGNISSHAMTEARYRVARDPEAGILAMKVEKTGRALPAPSIGYGDALAYSKARIDSNGSRMAVEILPSEE